jgi:acyl-CoA thioesterase-1
MSMCMKFFLLLGLVLSGVAGAAPVLLVHGDSLSAAYGIPREVGWVSLLERRLSAWQVVNASVSGETSAGGLTRLPELLRIHQPRLVILELGANDGLRGLPPDRTAANLEAMIDLARRQGAQVLLVGMRLPPNYGQEYAAKFQALFAQTARRKKTGFVPFLLEGMAEKRDQFQADGLHPTAQAQPVLLDNVWRGLQPLLRRLEAPGASTTYRSG